MTIRSSRIGAGIAGALLLGIAAMETSFSGRAPSSANALTALIGLAMLVASAVGARLD